MVARGEDAVALRGDGEGGGGGASVGAPWVLVVDDDSALRAVLAATLGYGGFAVGTAADAAGALDWLAARRPDAVLLDLSLPTSPGEVVAEALRDRWGGDVPIVVMSASDDGQVRAAALGATAFLRKPFDLAELLEALRGARAAP